MAPSAWLRFERILAFLLPLAVFLPASWILLLHYQSDFGDAAAREANAYYVFFSNDPHLAAIGFVWNPLMSISEMPLILLKGLWPALTADMMAAGVMSSLFMAGACYQLFRLMTDLGVGRVLRWALLACFLVDPMILFYGANGMSESLFIFLLVATTRHLVAWLENDRTRSLVLAGVWMGLAYAARNEAAMAAFVSTVLVLVVSYQRASGAIRVRRMKAVTDAVVFCLPFTASFVGWAGVSWIITGHPFEQFSSIYGTSAQLKTIAQEGGQPTGLAAAREAVTAVVTLAPLLVVAAVAAFARAWRDRDVRILAIVTVLGATVGFEFVVFLMSMILDSYRYLIYCIPLTVCLAAYAGRPVPKSRAETVEEQLLKQQTYEAPYLAIRRRRRALLSCALAVTAVAAFLPGIFTAYHEMIYAPGRLSEEEKTQLAWIVAPKSNLGRKYSYDSEYAPGIARQAAAFDSLHASHGTLMLDDAVGCVPLMILKSKHPEQFAIPNDIDFVERLGAPYEDGVRYMFVADPRGTSGALDSLDREWPTLFDSGAGLGRMVYTVTLPGCTTYRLYKLYPVKA